MDISKNKTYGATNVGVIIGVIVVIAIVAFLFTQNQDNTAPTTADTTSESEQMAADDTEMEKMDSETTMSDEEMNRVDAEEKDMVDIAVETDMAADVMVKNEIGTFADYDPDLLVNAEDGTVLVFFHASWCPSCRGLEKSIEENMSDLPGDVTILKVNYDTATELKKKYGVVRQHTLVQVDANGEKVQTLTGLTNTLDQVLAQI